MEHLNKASEGKYNIKFSSMKAYFNSVFAESKKEKVEYEVHTKDFWKFDHWKTPNAYWSGYYSNYPVIKHDIMQFSDFVQSATQILNIGSVSAFGEEAALRMQQELLHVNSVMQHHDAITGTHMWVVGEDYKKMMKDARDDSLHHEENGVLDKSLKNVARSQGFELHDLNVCEMEGNVVKCAQLM